VGGSNSDEGTYTVVLYIYKYFEAVGTVFGFSLERKLNSAAFFIPAAAGDQVTTRTTAGLHMLEEGGLLHKILAALAAAEWLAVGMHLAVLRIHEILVRIRMRIWIRGSIPLTNGSRFGSGSCYFRQ
jgi:hypothetical protein